MQNWIVLKDFKIYIKISNKTAATCFGVTVTPVAKASTNNALPDDGVTVTPKYVGAVLLLILM